MVFQWGIYAEPIFSKDGGFPKEFEERVIAKSIQQGYQWSRLPTFTEEEKAFVRGTFDYFGINHYTAILVSATEHLVDHIAPSVQDDAGVGTFVPKEWPQSASSWLRVR